MMDYIIISEFIIFVRHHILYSMKDGFKGSRAIVLPYSVVREMENDILGSKLHITDIGYYPAASLHKRVHNEGIPQYVLIYCVDGQGWYELHGRRYSISSNQCFILPANVPHAYGASTGDPWTIYWIHFRGELAMFYAMGFEQPISIIPSKESRIYDRINIFEDVFNALERGYGRDNLLFASSALYYFLGSIKYLGVFRESAGLRTPDKDIVDMAVAFMKENIEKQVSLKELSEYVGYSESYFLALFRKRTGYSPINYIIQIKMQTACRLLDFTDMKINQICHKVGISDPYYFSKLFTKTIGISPSEYKKLKKG